MTYWIFKLAKQELYPDIHGDQYVFDNTHSVRVQADDIFIYLDKREGYAFTATGTIKKLIKRAPTPAEAKRTSKVRTVFTAHLADLIWFEKPLSISPQTKGGKSNRAKLGIVGVNALGWSQSMPALNEAMYQAIMDLTQAKKLALQSTINEHDYSVPDAWGKTKIRKAVARFSNTVFERHGKKCVVCGTQLEEVIEAAHLSPYAADKNNRANPANGVCLCTYCHRALDRRLIAICPDGRLLISSTIDDPIALTHFQRVTTGTRKQWLNGVEPVFLELTVMWFKQNNNG
jgi:HNH endonuclease